MVYFFASFFDRHFITEGTLNTALPPEVHLKRLI